MLPVGIVIPTKNSRPYLPAHLAGLREWLDVVAEVVVVDSFSTDGTVEYLRGSLTHPNITFASRPPGLYASWNHGISRVRAPYVFMATTGDLIKREGLEQLVQSAETLVCDVVISKPVFRDLNDQPLPDVRWPIDDVIETLGITTPRKLGKLEPIVFAAANPGAALLGSSASNLYRTETLKRLPFPTDFGTTGDGAWGWLHAAEVSWGVVPEKFSSFLVHPSNASADEKKSHRESRRADEVMRQAMVSWRQSGAINDGELRQLRWDELMACLGSYLDAKAAFDRDRRGKGPWILNPRAWRNRMRRESYWRRLHELKRAVLRAAS